MLETDLDLDYSPPTHFPLHQDEDPPEPFSLHQDAEYEEVAEPTPSPPPSYRSASPISDAIINIQTVADVHQQNEALRGDSF